MLINYWTQLRPDTLNQVIDQLPKRLMMMVTKLKGAHLELPLDQFSVHNYC